MAKRKHEFEFALNMQMYRSMLLQQDGLGVAKKYNLFTEDHPCHIYLICKRPRITVNIKKYLGLD
jgi:hypothetical protein